MTVFLRHHWAVFSILFSKWLVPIALLICEVDTPRLLPGFSFPFMTDRYNTGLCDHLAFHLLPAEMTLYTKCKLVIMLLKYKIQLSGPRGFRVTACHAGGFILRKWVEPLKSEMNKMMSCCLLWSHLVVQLLSRVRLFGTVWTAARQASLSLTVSQSLLKLMSIESVIPSNHLILSCLLLLLPSIFLSIRIFPDESALCISWPKYWNFSISPSNEIQGWFPLGWTGWISLQSKGLSRVFSNTTVQKHQFFSPTPLYGPALTSRHDHWKNYIAQEPGMLGLRSHPNMS